MSREITTISVENYKIKKQPPKTYYFLLLLSDNRSVLKVWLFLINY